MGFSEELVSSSLDGFSVYLCQEASFGCYRFGYIDGSLDYCFPGYTVMCRFRKCKDFGMTEECLKDGN